jgi:hypothetical protein
MLALLASLAWNFLAASLTLGNSQTAWEPFVWTTAETTSSLLLHESSWHLILERLAACAPDQLPKVALVNRALGERAESIARHHLHQLWRCQQCGSLQGAEATRVLNACILCSRCLFGVPLGAGYKWLSWRRATPNLLRLVRRGPSLATVFFTWQSSDNDCQLFLLHTPPLTFSQLSANTVDMFASEECVEFPLRLAALLTEMQRQAGEMFGLQVKPA